MLQAALLGLPLAWVAYERRQSDEEQRMARSIRSEYVKFEPWHVAWDWPERWWTPWLDELCGPRLTEVEITPPYSTYGWNLASLTCVRSLELGGAQVTNLHGISGMRRLEDLTVLKSELSDLTPLKALPHLLRLRVSSSEGITDLTPLAALTELQTLSIERTRVADLRPITGLKNLTQLSIAYTQVQDLSPLAQLPQLTTLDCAGLQLDDWSPLAELSELESIDLSGAKLKDLKPLLGLKKLTGIRIWYNAVSEAQFQEFRQAMPQCVFIGWEEPY